MNTKVYNLYLKSLKLINKKNSHIIYDKTRYVVHIRLLQQALKHGLKSKKIHRVINFDQ